MTQPLGNDFYNLEDICKKILTDPELRAKVHENVAKINEHLAKASAKRIESLRAASRLTDGDFKVRINVRD